MGEQQVGLGGNSADKTTTTQTVAAATATATKKPRGTVTADAEVTAMAKISKLMNDLDAANRSTVAAWFVGKYKA